MKSSNNKGFLFSAVIMLIAALLQTIGLVRNLNRLPDDLLGVSLYVVTIGALLLAAAGFYLSWKKQNIHYFL